jgi:hypothetical protein
LTRRVVSEDSSSLFHRRTYETRSAREVDVAVTGASRALTSTSTLIRRLSIRMLSSALTALAA